jgi:hypothetical protein
MDLRFGEMHENIPLSWLINGNSKKETSVSYQQINENTYGFAGKQENFPKPGLLIPCQTVWIKNHPNGYGNPIVIIEYWPILINMSIPALQPY